MNRYAAKLLFQFRVTVGRVSNRRRRCEERIIVLRASSARGALVQAKRYGNRNRYTYDNTDGNDVHFEFLGVMELLELGLECDKEEVWWEHVHRIRPSEKRSSLIPTDAELLTACGST
jgi:hypothetical protein